METKEEIASKAKALMETDPDRASELYSGLWNEYPEQCDVWDAFYTMKAMRRASSPNLLLAGKIIEKFKEDEKVQNLYAWLVFDRCVKNKNRNELIKNEKIISNLVRLVPQKKLKEDDRFPCPVTIAVFKLCDAHAENFFHAGKIKTLLSTLNPEIMSDKVKTLSTPERGDIELPSDLEKYYSLMTKALFKLGEFESCKTLCNEALEMISKLHFNNDLWFNMRIALSEEALGNHEASEQRLKKLLKSKAGNDKWFLYRDISEIYFEQKEYEKAWKYAVEAAFYGNEPHFLIGLYLLQVRILYKLQRVEQGRILAELIAAILKEQQWNDADYLKLFNFYKIDRSNLLSVVEIMKIVRRFWQQERYGHLTKQVGEIVSIHKNGKKGKIKIRNGETMDFYKKDLVKRMKTIESLDGAQVEFYVMESFDGNHKAEQIEIVRLKMSSTQNEESGKIVMGIVKNITDFGLFVRMKNFPDGLLHENSMPESMKNDFKEQFHPGDRVKVKIERITHKGCRLSWVP